MSNNNPANTAANNNPDNNRQWVEEARFIAGSQGEGLERDKALQSLYNSAANCGGGTAPHWHADRSACSDAHVGSVSTECLIITMLRRGGVALHFDTRLHSDLVANANGTGRGRRLAARRAGSRSAPPRARLRRDAFARPRGRHRLLLNNAR